MQILKQGWLLAQPKMPDVVLGIEVPPETRTRKEEYAFAVEALKDVPGALIWDSATGYIPEWHRMAKILAQDGRTVIATDMEPGVLDLPPDPHVTYLIADSRCVPFPDGLFSAALCISSLEHMVMLDIRFAVSELIRCTKPGGRLVLTADWSPWLPCLFGAVMDSTPPPEGGLDPQVYYVVVET